MKTWEKRIGWGIRDKTVISEQQCLALRTGRGITDAVYTETQYKERYGEIEETSPNNQRL